MRQWHVPVDCLCNKHLLGEHVEHHMFRSVILRGNSVEGYIKDGLLWLGTLKSRHDQIAKAIEARGMRHTSFFHPFDEKQEMFGTVAFSVPENLRELQRRCPECRQRIEKFYDRIDSDIPVGGDYYTMLETGNIAVFISGKFVDSAQTKAKAIVVMERTRKQMREDGTIWQIT